VPANNNFQFDLGQPSPNVRRPRQYRCRAPAQLFAAESRVVGKISVLPNDHPSPSRVLWSNTDSGQHAATGTMPRLTQRRGIDSQSHFKAEPDGLCKRRSQANECTSGVPPGQTASQFLVDLARRTAQPFTPLFAAAGAGRPRSPSRARSRSAGRPPHRAPTWLDPDQPLLTNPVLTVTAKHDAALPEFNSLPSFGRRLSAPSLKLPVKLLHMEQHYKEVKDKLDLALPRPVFLSEPGPAAGGFRWHPCRLPSVRVNLQPPLGFARYAGER